MKFTLKRVRYIPAELQSRILYVSKEFGIAVHLCACGCSSKVRTPLGPTEWSVKETKGGPTLRPSVGNWQEACQSHYLITRGEVVWVPKWSPEEIAAGRLQEEQRRRSYYERLDRGRVNLPRRLRHWLRSFFGR
jgi:hypothetical protein